MHRHRRNQLIINRISNKKIICCWKPYARMEGIITQQLRINSIEFHVWSPAAPNDLCRRRVKDLCVRLSTFDTLDSHQDSIASLLQLRISRINFNKIKNEEWLPSHVAPRRHMLLPTRTFAGILLFMDYVCMSSLTHEPVSTCTLNLLNVHFRNSRMTNRKRIVWRERGEDV